MNAIEIRSLSKSYGGKKAVDDLSLSIRQGELFSLLGVNGAGKSTAIGMLCGVVRPDSGDALLMGHSILTDSAAAKRVLNVSPQESAVAPKLSVRENLEFIAAIYGCGSREAQSRSARMIEEMEMQAVAAQRAGTLSGGWQRRLSIAMALITEPQLLFLDEPTLGLDVLARRELWALLKRLHGRVTVLLTTHYLEEAEALSDRIGILQKGRLRALGTPEELKRLAQADTFEEAFVNLAQEEIK